MNHFFYYCSPGLSTFPCHTKLNNSACRAEDEQTLDKVNHRLGRLVQKCPSAYAYYDIRVIADEEKQKAIDLNWEKDPA